MSDRGIPASYRHMHGFSSHTLSFWNADGERYWVKWHFKTNQGIRTLGNEEAARMPLHGAQQDLVESIKRGEYPSWTVAIQIMTPEQALDYAINPFDLTKVWPYADYPLIEVGQLELNRNVRNYFAETEQAAFSPSNLVPGIGASPDRMLQARLLAYPDAHRYRVGANFHELPVNAPRCPVQHYQRDGAMAGMPGPRGESNQQYSVENFYPNDHVSSGAPAPCPAVAEPPMPLEENAWLGTSDSRHDDNFSQAGALFRVMNAEQQEILCANIASGLSQAGADARARMLEYFGAADTDYRAGVERALSNLA